jgi:hypothetical protein
MRKSKYSLKESSSLPMIDLALIQQTKQSLAALKTFASQSNNEQLPDRARRLETTQGALTAASGPISVGDISGSTAVDIGRDIHIIVLPLLVRQGLGNVQKKGSAVHLEIRQVLDCGRGGHVFR